MRTAVYSEMSEVIEPGLELLERQNRFVSEHLRRIFVQIYRIVGNVADAQDLTQEAFIKALQHQDQLKDEQKAAHWLSRIATNTAIDFLRRNGRATFCEIEEAPESHAESPEQALLRVRTPGVSGRRFAAVEPPRAGGAACCATWKGCRRRKWPTAGLLQGHGAIAHRQRPHQIAPVHGKKEAVRE